MAVLVNREELTGSNADLLALAQEQFKNAEPGTDEYEAAAKAIEVLSRVIRDDEKTEIERDSYLAKIEDDRIKYEIEQKNKKIEFVTNTALGVAGIVVPVIAYDKFSKRVLKFEETGTISSSVGRNVLNNLPNPFRKR